MNGIAPAFSRAASLHPDLRGATVARAVRRDRHAWMVGGMIWILLLLMIVPDRLDYASLASESAPQSGGIVSRLLWLGLLGFGLLVVGWQMSLAWLVVQRLNFFLLAFVLLAVASIAWSMEPAVTARRLIRVITIVIDATAFVLVGWHARRFQNVVRPAITVVLLGSLMFGAGWPDLATHPESWGALAGTWHGLANHKNGLGALACIGLIFWFHAWLTQGPSRRALLGGTIAAACLYLSDSSTAVVAAVFTLLFLAMLLRAPRVLQRYMPYLVVLFVGALLVYSLALLELVPGLHMLLSPISAITGKDMTFTGRTDIWDILSEHVRLHPYLGSGYAAYWIGAYDGTPSYDFIRRLFFYPGSAHNGYLEIVNDLGAVGLLVLLGYLATFVVQSLRLLKTDRHQAALYLALFLQAGITNLSETHWFSSLSVSFVLMTLATTSLARSLLERRLQRAQETARRRMPGAHLAAARP